MSDEPIILPESTPTKTRLHERFPAVAQFLILSTLLGVLFGALLFPKLFSHTAKTASVGTAITATSSNKAPVVVAPLKPAHLSATAAFVYDVSTDRVLYEHGADKVLPLASITKLMTALITREVVNNDRTLKVPSKAVSQASASGLVAGETLTSEALRSYAVLASSNDAAYTLAASVGALLTDHGDPHATFVEAMNIRAHELKLDTLHFKNATGLDLSASEPGAVGSARDISFLMEYIVQNYPDILEPTTLASDRIYNKDGAFHEAENTNPIIDKIPHLLGSKTGYTDLAGGNLTVAFDAGYNHPIIITVLGSTYDDRFADVLTLVKSVREALQAAEVSQNSQ